MKPYNERLPLIDEAIDDLNGSFENCWYSYDNTLLFLFSRYPNKIGPHARNMKWRGYYYGSSTPEGIFVCTRQEFERRVKEHEKMSKNDWYEKGELPPVGVECKYFSSEMGEYRDCTVAAEWKDGVIVVDKEDDACEIAYKHNLRPLRTEEYELLEKALNDINLHNVPVPPKITARSLIKAGWRPTK